MRPIGTGKPQFKRAHIGQARRGAARPATIGFDIGAAWSNEAEAPLAGSDKHSQKGRAASGGSTILPAVWHPSFEKHWQAADDGSAELMRAAFGAPAKPAPLRIAGPPATSVEPPAERQQPSPRAIDRNPQARFQTSVVMSLIVFVVLLAAAFTPSIR